MAAKKKTLNRELTELDKVLAKVSAERRKLIKAMQKDPTLLHQSAFDRIADLEKEAHRLMSEIK